jgi:peptidoglycan hydrolase-like protein with peptidoglycan-binding domain
LQFYGGAIDGELGPRTRGALSAFQTSVGLEPSGVADDATLRELEQQHDGAA